MTIYNVIKCIYNCSEDLCHDGDPTISITSYEDLTDAQKAVDEIVNAYKADIDEDCEPREPYDCERTTDGAVCTSRSALVEAVITIEETELL